MITGEMLTDIKKCIGRCGDNGTVFLVSSKLAVTAKHVIDKYIENKEVYIELQFPALEKEIIKRATIIDYTDDKYDMAVLLLDEEVRTNINYLKFSLEPLDISDSWYTFGYPQGSRQEGDCFEGSVEDNSVINHNDGYYYYDIKLHCDGYNYSNIPQSLLNGLSGAPLIVNGEFRGIITNELYKNLGAVNVKGFNRVLANNNIPVEEIPLWIRNVDISISKTLEKKKVKSLLKINRGKLIDSLENFVSSGNGAVIGKPGTGKSYSITELRYALKVKGIPTIIIYINDYLDGTDSEIQKELIIRNKENIINKLKRESEKMNLCHPGVLIFDGYDAARNEDVKEYFLKLISQAIKELEGKWNIIVTIRTYDASKAYRLIELFPSNIEKNTDEFYNHEIKCRNFVIPPLDKDEIRQTFNQVNGIENIYNNCTERLKEILSVPFNLWLLEKILDDYGYTVDLSYISSEIQLLNKFWDKRVRGESGGFEKEKFLYDVVDRMVKAKTLVISAVSLSVNERVWEELLRDDIIVLDKGSQKRKLLFSHNILFDYAVSTLAMEDDIESVLNFVSEDVSRAIFLRPSFTYYFCRLWYEERDLFWNMFLNIPELVEKKQLPLIIKLFPVNIIATETQQVDELTTLIDILDKSNCYISDMILRLMHALQALDIKKDSVWIQFIYKAIHYKNDNHLGFAADMVGKILHRAEQCEDTNLVGFCGEVSRELFKWVWEKREIYKNGWYDSIGADLIVPLVCETFKTNPLESKKLLEKILELPRENDFPIKYLFRLTHKIHRIWSWDEEFVADIYSAVFSYKEKSNSKTNMGGSMILSLVSNRRQDYGMCYYNLSKVFPQFLEYKPVTAVKAALVCLSKYLILEHLTAYSNEEGHISQFEKEFCLNGYRVTYIEDRSYIWADNEYINEPVEIAYDLFKYLEDIAMSDDEKLLNSVLEVFYTTKVVAFWWKMLLKTASKVPKTFSRLLHELCISPAILSGDDTIREVGLFIEAAQTYFTSEQLHKIECAILNIGNKEFKDGDNFHEHRRNRLLARISKEYLTTDEGKAIYEKMESENNIPDNKPLFSVTVTNKVYDSISDRLKDHGIDIKNEETSNLHYLDQLDEFNRKMNDSKLENEDLNQITTVLQVIYPTLQGNEVKGTKVVKDSLWKAFSSCLAKVVSLKINNMNQELEFFTKALIDCAKHELPVLDKYTSKLESRVWSPAPRNDAAEILPHIAALGKNNDILPILEILVQDEVPSVRWNAVRNLWGIAGFAKEKFWELVTFVIEYEDNLIVKQGIVDSLKEIIKTQGDKTIKVLNTLFENEIKQEKYDLICYSIDVLLWLYIRKNNDWAKDNIMLLVEKGVSDCVDGPNGIAFIAFQYIEPEAIVDDNIDSVNRTVLLLGEILDYLMLNIGNALSCYNGEIDNNDNPKLEDMYKLLDSIISRMYFNAKIIDEQEKETITNEQRRAYYFRIKKLLDKIVNWVKSYKVGILHAQCIHYIMQLLNGVLDYEPRGVLIIAKELVISGEKTGYNLDSLAEKEVIKLVERIIADYKNEIKDNDTLKSLLSLLDVFAKVGWAEAIRFIWRLEEVFR